MGSGYVVEHCIAAFSAKQEEKAYRVYITDALKAIAENTAKFAGGAYLKARWVDTVTRAKETKQPEQVDNRSCKEISDDIFKRIWGGD